MINSDVTNVSAPFNIESYKTAEGQYAIPFKAKYLKLTDNSVQSGDVLSSLVMRAGLINKIVSFSVWTNMAAYPMAAFNLRGIKMKRIIIFTHFFMVLPAHAGIVIHGTRIIYPAENKSDGAVDEPETVLRCCRRGLMMAIRHYHQKNSGSSHVNATSGKIGQIPGSK